MQERTFVIKQTTKNSSVVVKHCIAYFERRMAAFSQECESIISESLSGAMFRKFLRHQIFWMFEIMFVSE